MEKMKKTLSNYAKRAAAGIAALALIAGSYTAATSKYDADTFTAVAAGKTTPGDANCDGKIDINDVITLAKYLKDSSKYPLTEQGKINASAAYKYGVNGTPSDLDLQAIIESLSGLYDLPTGSVKTESVKTIQGDADCDGDVDFNDVEALNKYLSDAAAYSLTEQGKINASAAYKYGVTGTPSDLDLQAIIESLSGLYDLPTGSVKTESVKTIQGDADCDGDVDFNDYEALNKYLSDAAVYPLTEQGKINASAAYKYGLNGNPNDSDLQAIAEYLAGVNELPTGSLKLKAANITNDLDKPFLPGDFNCDGTVDIVDAAGIETWLNITDSNRKISLQALRNGDVYDPGTGLTVEDAKAIEDQINGNVHLPVYSDDYLEQHYLLGDFNCDNVVNTKDVMQLNSYVQGSTDYKPSEQGLKNADVYKKGSGITFEDVAAIAESIKGTNKLPTEKIVNIGATTLYGDFNCDNVVNTKDVMQLNSYVQGSTDYKPSEQGLKNADVYKKGAGITFEDVAAIAEFINGTNDLPTEKIVNVGSKTALGDFNCDTVFNVADAVMFQRYIDSTSDYVPSEQGKINADLYMPGLELDYKDLELMLNALKAGVEPLIENPVVTTTVPAPTTTKPATTTKAVATTTKAVATTTKAVATTTKAAATTVPATTTAPKALQGDINDDGKVNVADLVTLNKALACSGKITAACDVNGDGRVNLFDSIALRMILMKLI